MSDQTPANHLREAARVLRDRATDTSWHPACGGWWLPPSGPHAIAEADIDVAYATTAGTAAYIATMHPGVGLALADWLDEIARDFEIARYGYWSVRATEIADLILGGK